MDSLSRLIYPAFSLPISTQMIKAIKKINFILIWSNKCQYIRKDDTIKKYKDGWVNAIDFDIMNGVLSGVASVYAGAYGPGQIGGPPSRGGTFN